MKYCFIIFIFLPQFLKAQTTFEQIYSASNHYFQGLDVKQTSDEGFLVLSVASTATDFFYTKVNIIKLNKNGEIVWSKDYNFNTNFQKSGDLILLEKDSFAFLIGDAANAVNKIITKATPNGDVVWSKNIGNIEFEPNIEKIISLTTNKERNTLGIFNIEGERPHSEIFGAKMDTNGNIAWMKSYRPSEFGAFELFNRISGRSTSDGGYILCGNMTDLTIHSDAFLMRIDALGNILWAKGYGNTALHFQETGLSVVQTHDSGYIVAGTILRGNQPVLQDGFLMKVDAFGEILWITFVKINTDTPSACVFSDIQLTEDEIVTVSGIYLNNQQGINSILLKIDQNGNLLNHQKYQKKLKFSNAAGLDITVDGGAVLLNSARDNAGNRALYLIKTDETGDSGCSDSFPVEITRLDSFPTIPLMLTSTDLDTIVNRMPIVTDFNDWHPPIITPPPTVDIEVELNEMCTNDTAIITFTGTDFFKYEWSNGIIDQTQITVTEEGSYSITVTGCGKAFDETTIDCEYPFDECIAIPNAFTPNGDNINDQFEPIIYEECERGIEIKEVIIWSRWGKKIFEGNSVDASWDGKFQNRTMPADVYFYRVCAESREMEEMIFKGNITLVR